MLNHVNTSRRRVFQKLLGMGAGVAVNTVFSQQGGAAVAEVSAMAPARAVQPIAPGAFAGIHDVRRYGAAGDGKTLDTPAINRAIEAAAAAGGGTVRFPAGNYLCFSIHLKSKVTLYLGQGATIVAADPAEGSGYDAAEPNPWDQYQDFGHSHWHNALLWGEGLSDVAVQGPGLIWGKGLTRGPNERAAGVGDKAIALKNCHNVALRDFSILEGGHFGLLATGVDNLTVDNLLIDTNRDGLDFDCCHNVRVSNCTVNSPWDDGICPKSSYALGYARATQNVAINNCFVTGGYQVGTLLDGTFKPFPSGVRVPGTGRIKCGTESNGGFQNIAISNCVFDRCQGLALETVDGALLEDVSISNITMRDVTSSPIFLRLGSRLRGPAGTAVGKLRRVNISDIVVHNTASRYASVISGIPGYAIEDISLHHIHILHEGGGTREDAGIIPPEKENAYPKPIMFGTTPCYGFFIRHVNGISMSHIDLKYAKDEMRPPFALDDVQHADFIHIKAQRAANVPLFALKRTKDFNTYLSRPLADTHLDHAEQEDV